MALSQSIVAAAALFFSLLAVTLGIRLGEERILPPSIRGQQCNSEQKEDCCVGVYGPQALKPFQKKVNDACGCWCEGKKAAEPEPEADQCGGDVGRPMCEKKKKDSALLPPSGIGPCIPWSNEKKEAPACHPVTGCCVTVSEFQAFKKEEHDKRMAQKAQK